MKILLIAPGSRGDVQPYIALGTGLRDAGHTVRILTTEDFRELVTAYGLEFVGMGDAAGDAQSQMQGIVEGGNLLKILASTGRGAQQLAHQGAVSGLAASGDADMIIGGFGGLFIGLALAEKVGIPFIQAYLVPFTPTRAFPGVLLPPLPVRLPAQMNGVSHRLTQQMMWQMFRTADTKARTEVLGMAPASRWGPFAALQRHAQPILYGYSPQVVPRPADWGDFVHVTGYWFLEPPAGWEPPADLVAFLRAGPPPVFIGFGSMPSKDPAATADLMVQALARTGQRGVIVAGGGDRKETPMPEHVYRVGSVPHSWLFPQMAAVVHHGGAGTTAAGLRAGVPSVVTPFFGDQPFWGQRVHALGVGPEPVPRRHLTVENLAAAIQRATSDTAMREKAAQLGTRIRAEDGVARAVAVIEQQFSR